MADYTQYPVSSLVPHSPPMVLIDAVLDYSDRHLTAAVDIRERSMFFDAALGGVPAWVGVEYMAQAISAWAGVQALQQGEPIRPGFLLGSRRLKLPEKVLNAGRRYTVMVEQLFRDDSGLASFDCRITHDGVLCVEARVNVFEVDDIAQISGGRT